MTVKKADPVFKLGDMVRILRSNYKRAKIVELRGPLAPGGVHVYRVIVRRKPSPVYIEVREDQLELLPIDAAKELKKAVKNTVPTFKVGDTVQLRYSGLKRAKIVELRGPLGTEGKQVYRIMVRRKPSPLYIEVFEEQLEIPPAEA